MNVKKDFNFRLPTWRAQFIKRTTKSNCWCSNIALFPTTCCESSEHKANLAALLLSALPTAGNVFLASEILFSNMQLMQFFKTSSRRAESEIPGRLSDMVDMCGPFGTILGCAGRKEDNLLTKYFFI